MSKNVFAITLSWWSAWLESVRLADVLDVAVLSIFLFLVLDWLRHTGYGRLWTVLLILALGLAISRGLGMYLTQILIQAVLAAAAVALIVVFQDEIRRFFERLSRSEQARGSSPGRTADLLRDVVEAAFTMASTATGALIVFRGREPLDRLLSGGVTLNGHVSQPLLLSIFQPETPGHDGAVVVDRGRISMFAAHLPLTKDPPARGPTGTRHAAAIGISARSDALAVVVSEERRQVSIAERGVLTAVGSAAELQAKLEEFASRYEAAQRKRPAARYVLGAAPLALLSVVLASSFWFLFTRPIDTVQRSFDVAIEYRNLPEHVFLDSPETDAVRVTLSGSTRMFAELEPGQLIVSLDAANLTEGRHELPVSPGDLKLPAGVVVEDVEPRAVTVVAQRLIPVTVPVSVTTEGKPPEPWVVAALESVPREVTIWAPRQRAGTLRLVETEPVDLSAMVRSDTLRVPLILPEGTRASTDETEVSVHIAIAGGPSSSSSESRPREAS